jgi:hypothetical protein
MLCQKSGDVHAFGHLNKKREEGFAMHVNPLMKLWIAWVISNVFQYN